jgi:hypothetical protein
MNVADRFATTFLVCNNDYMNTNTTTTQGNDMTYRTAVIAYETAKAEGRWADAEAAAEVARTIGATLGDIVCTALRDDALAEVTATPTVVVAPVVKADKPTARYIVVKDETELPCDHPMCGQLHKNLPSVLAERERAERYAGWAAANSEYYNDPNEFHMVKHRQWVIIDTTTDERAWTGEVYDRRKDAVADLNSRLSRA